MKKCFYSLLIMTVLFGLGCDKDDHSSGATVRSNPSSNNGVLQIEIQPAYVSNSPVTFALINNGSLPVDLPNTAPWEIRRGTTLVFKPASGTIPTQILPGGKQSWTWNQLDNSGARAPSGETYNVVFASFNISSPFILDALTSQILLNLSVSPFIPQGQTVTIVLQNLGQATVIFPTATLIEIKNSAGTIVFPPAAANVPTPFRPGQQQQYDWDQKDKTGVQVPTGTYTIIVQGESEKDHPVMLTQTFVIN